MAADPKDKSVQFIAKLVQLTQDKRVRWEPIPYPGSDSNQGAAYSTAVEGKQLRLYRAMREVIVNDVIASAIFGGAPEQRKRSTQVAILEVLDDFGQATFTFDRTTGLNDLYESAAYSASRVDDLMDAILRRK